MGPEPLTHPRRSHLKTLPRVALEHRLAASSLPV